MLLTIAHFMVIIYTKNRYKVSNDKQYFYDAGGLAQQSQVYCARIG